MNYDQKPECCQKYNRVSRSSLDNQGFFSEKVIFALRLRDEWEQAEEVAFQVVRTNCKEVLRQENDLTGQGTKKSV